MRIFRYILVCCCLVAHFCQAAEIDSITPCSRELPDAADTLNGIINARLQSGIEAANARQDEFTFFSERTVCDEEILYTELRKAIFQSFSASLGLKGYSLDKQLRELLGSQGCSLPLKDSIYRDITFFEGISLNLKELSDVIMVRGHLVGLDKIGHFFAEGWEYFEHTRADGATVEDAMAWGTGLEKGSFGYLTTGIYSYADLVANFNGFRFWNGLRKRQRDPLKGVVADFFTSVQVTCSLDLIDSLKKRKIVRKWVLNRPFDIADYIDGSWNEANNCNSYRDPDIAEKVAVRIAEVRPGFQCPAEGRACIQAEKKYGSYAQGLLHPRCLPAAGTH